MSEAKNSEAEARKNIPLSRGLFDYFPDALMAIAENSRIGSIQHHPGEGIFWERGKSMDHPDALLRHFVDRGRLDSDGIRHSTKVAWRALAILQEEIELEIANSTGQSLKEVSSPASRWPKNMSQEIDPSIFCEHHWKENSPKTRCINCNIAISLSLFNKIRNCYHPQIITNCRTKAKEDTISYSYTACANCGLIAPF